MNKVVLRVHDGNVDQRYVVTFHTYVTPMSYEVKSSNEVMRLSSFYNNVELHLNLLKIKVFKYILVNLIWKSLLCTVMKSSFLTFILQHFREKCSFYHQQF